MIKTLNSLDKGENIVDLTSATEDYPLAVGQTATITFIAVTSVPLHVATVEGLYEMTVVGNIKTATTSSFISLQPNNADTSNIKSVVTANNGTVYGSAETNNTRFHLAAGAIFCGRSSISTFTQSKTVLTDGAHRESGATSKTYMRRDFWDNTSTVWSSLGTIVLSESQTGKIVIRRIA